MGCFYCQRRAVWDSVGPYDETIMRGQTVDYGMRARLHGWRCVAIPNIEFIHHHTNRSRRSSQSDADSAISAARERFREKWGFDRVAPDLDDVTARYRGTPLMWNARVFGPSTCSHSPVSIEQSRWQAYADDPRAQQVVANQVDLVTRAIGAGQPRRIVQFGCGEGLLCHLLAQQGYATVGVDRNPHLIDLARSVTQRSTYTAQPPHFIYQLDQRSHVVDMHVADVVLLIDVMHTHSNPAGLLKQARHALADDGMLLVVMPERSTPLDTDVDRHHLYRDHELIAQINATELFMIDRAFDPQVPGLLVKLCRPRVAGKQQRQSGPAAVDRGVAVTS